MTPERWMALVAAGSAFLGSLIGAGPSYVVARLSADASAHESELALRRDVYVKYYGDIAQYVSTLGTSSAAVKEAIRANPRDHAALKAVDAELQAHVATIFSDRGRLSLFAPRKARTPPSP
jgi:hypothetical protein